ncbi:MAG: FeoB-associated Cys-rich membrane protein [Ruminococcus sp.]|nr:FeoB-associated Cys-rich membrane protein [Ruminococcus sp.]MDE6848199.1 FeoB-associated Cys-rich membrane protein [Ruminococcus sp.]MDE7138947.1 FeoB-associated Cys-rich membrane protein [Ruminococcus sp.]
MNITDILIITAIAVLLFLAIRTCIRSKKTNKCHGCCSECNKCMK